MNPPNHIDEARVLEWAWSDLPFGEVSSPDGASAVPVHGLALCQYEGSDQIYRFSCTFCWECVQDQVYGSMEQARTELPEQYRNQVVVWQAME